MAATVCEVCGANATTATVDVRKHNVGVFDGERRIIWTNDGDAYLLRCDEHARHIGVTETARVKEAQRLADEQWAASADNPANLAGAVVSADSEAAKSARAQAYAEETARTAEAAKVAADDQAKRASDAQKVADDAKTASDEALTHRQADDYAAARAAQDGVTSVSDRATGGVPVATGTTTILPDRFYPSTESGALPLIDVPATVVPANVEAATEATPYSTDRSAPLVVNTSDPSSPVETGVRSPSAVDTEGREGRLVSDTSAPGVVDPPLAPLTY
jgi:hypothetical protein